jgi:hypothetical protein
MGLVQEALNKFFDLQKRIADILSALAHRANNVPKGSCSVLRPLADRMSAIRFFG